MSKQFNIEIKKDPNSEIYQGVFTTKNGKALHGLPWNSKILAQLEMDSMRIAFLEGQLQAYSEIDMLRIKTLANLNHE